MKTITKLLVAGAAVAAGGVANAQITVLPSATNGSDLILFVTDTTTGTYFIQDLGIGINSLGPTTASIASDPAYSIFGTGSAGPLSIPSSLNFTDSSLATFTSTAGNTTGNSYVYSILGAGTGAGNQNAGQQRFVATYTAANGSLLFNSEPGSNNAANSAQGTAGWFEYLNGTGTGTQFASGSGTGQQAAGGFSLGASNLASTGTATFFYETATYGPGNDANVYASTESITVNTNGVISVSGSTPVPLPAALWLLGSGVLGLFGIGRRRVAAQAA